MLYCKNVADGSKDEVTPIDHFPCLRLLLVHSKQPRSTSDQIEKVRRLKDEQPELFARILDQSSQLTKKALQFFSIFFPGYFDDRYNRQATVENLGPLFCDNQKLLVRLGASHPLLDRVYEVVPGQSLQEPVVDVPSYFLTQT